MKERRSHKWCKSTGDETACKTVLRVGRRLLQLSVTAVSRQQNPRELRHRLFAIPVTLQFAGELHACRWLAPGLDKALKSGVVRLWRRPADGIDNGEYFISLAQGIERGMHKHFRPQRCHDQLFATRYLDRLDEILVFPRVDCGAVDRFDVWKHVGDRFDHGLVDAGPDIDGRKHNGQAKQLSKLRHGHDIADEYVLVPRCYR
jgi:hypothetical protein